jgi:hypothetical protein
MNRFQARLHGRVAARPGRRDASGFDTAVAWLADGLRIDVKIRPVKVSPDRESALPAIEPDDPSGEARLLRGDRLGTG